MPKPRPLYLVHEKNRHGNWRWYFRRKGSPRVRLPDEFGSKAFWTAYQAALTGAPVVASPATVKGTLQWLVDRYRASGGFVALAPATQADRARIYRSLCKGNGDIDFRRVTTAKLRKAMDDKAATPHAANNYLVAMRVLFDWAVTHNLLTENPCVGVRKARAKITGHHTWTLDEVEQFRAKHPVGTRQRLALELMLFTGIRASDVVQVGRQHIRDRVLTITARKNKAPVNAPVAPPLWQAIEAVPARGLHLVVGERGRPFSSGHTFGQWFKSACVEAGLSHCSPHGLRKAGATLAAEAGASPHELMALYGWSRSAMAEVYTKAADRKRMARAAAERIANVAGPHRPLRLETDDREMAEIQRPKIVR